MHKKIQLATALALGLALFFVVSASGAATAPVLIGKVNFASGTITLTRSGAVTAGLKVGAALYNQDKLQTAAGASLEIAFDKSTGLTGIMKVKASTVCALSLEALKAGARTTVDLASGSVAVKETLAAGSSFSVKTSSAAMGVRGTSFEVTGSVNGNLLVDCEEGEVSCAPVDPLTGDEDAAKAVSALPGSVIEAREGEGIKKVPVAVSGLKKFREDWIAGEVALFRGNPVKTLRMLDERYNKLVGDFKKAFTELYGSKAFAAWKAEEKSGKAATDKATLLREKKEVGPLLLKLRKVAFIFEKVYYRIADVVPYLDAKALALELRKGYTVGDFVRAFEKDRAKLGEAMAIFRHAEKLFAERGGAEDSLFGGDSPLSGSGLLGGGDAPKAKDR